jgi:phosphoribosylanthranilate isomerase
VNTLVKICGVTQREQAEAIAAAGADFIGVNFWPGSKRFLSPEKAAAWVGSLEGKAEVIGVFVNADPGHLDAITQTIPLWALQLHGDETPEECARLIQAGHRVIKAFQVRDEATLDQIAAYAVEDVLLDAYHAGERGGTGETFPWKLAHKFLNLYPDRRLWLSGGLTPENVAVAVQGVRPCAVDVASGVESGVPGIKDLVKVGQFIRRAKAGL